MITLSGFSPIRQHALITPVNLNVNCGDIAVFMGPSGIGKSSLLESLAGSLPYQGNMNVLGNIFRVYQETDQLFPWMTVKDNLLLANKDADWQTLASEWDLGHLLKKLPNECSVGQRQRFTLLRALHSGREVLLCDEPLSGVDWNTAKPICSSFQALVSKYKKTVVWVTHNPREAELLGKVIKIK